MKPNKIQSTLSRPKGSRAAGRAVSRLGAALLALALMLSMTVTAFAYTRIDTSAQTSLTVNYTDEDGNAVSGTAFRLYRVADVSDAVVMTLSGAFADAPVSLSDIEAASEWNAIATTLTGYAAANGIAATAEKTTDENGQIVFDGLTVGLYLLVGDSAIIGDDLYTPVPAMILLPTLDESTDTWDYDPVSSVKYGTEQLQEYISLTVQKVWDDDSYSGRPDSVTVQLLQNDTVIDTVTLSADNSWKYTWTNLPQVSDLEAGTAYTYLVNEASVPDGYTVAVTQSGYVYKITNSREADTPVMPSTPTSPTLPQTGQLNWPIPYLVIAGLLLICAGLYLKCRDRKHGESK